MRHINSSDLHLLDNDLEEGAWSYRFCIPLGDVHTPCALACP